MLKPYYKSLEENKADEELVYERCLELRGTLEALWPEHIEASISFSCYGSGCIRAFIYLAAGASEEITREAVRALLKLGKAERNFRQENKSFYWMIRQEQSEREFERLIFIENAAPGKCSIKKVKKEIEVWEADCSEEPEAAAVQ